MKKSILLTFVVLVAASVMAQSQSELAMRVWENNVVTYQAPVDNVDSITYLAASEVGDALIGDLITGVTPIMEDGVEIGHKITFLRNAPINIYNGKDGKNGVDGKDGVDGTNGTNGTNGIDGITPKLKIEEDYWWVSYDSGETWAKLNKAKGDKGDKGDSMFKSVTQDDNKVYLTLADETVITIHKENSDFERTIKDNMVMVFTLDKHDIFIEPGHSELITAKTSPFSTSKVTWESSNEEIVTVSDGVVEAHGLGYAIITAIAADKIQTCNVMVAKKGTIPYSFSVSSTQKVFFSKGNLQYQASTEIWRFAEHQYDMIGNGNCNINDTYDDWIDLFGFGTGDNPTISSTNSSDYSKFVEWGKNVISNGGNTDNLWRTLKGEEWGYIFQSRANAASLFGFGRVNGVDGLIILPDEWTLPDGLTFNASTSLGLEEQGENFVNNSRNNYSHNSYTAEQWAIMEYYGAVFLPAAGDRNGTDLEMIGPGGYGNGGHYWSAVPYDADYSYDLNFNNKNFKPNFYHGVRILGESVRLVQDVE